VAELKESQEENNMAIEGGCYCGALRYAAEGEPAFKGQCHCRECQYISGGPPNVVLGMPENGFHYTQGKPKQFRRRDLENPVTREFCAECGTHIGTRSPHAPGIFILKVGTLDDPTLFDGPQMAIYTAEMQSWHHVPKGIATFAGPPGS
jgi:hypothetical protein